jgi:hypothetical protein
MNSRKNVQQHYECKPKIFTPFLLRVPIGTPSILANSYIIYYINNKIECVLLKWKITL